MRRFPQRFTTLFMTSILLLGVLVGFSSLLFFQSLPEKNSVYCPLQKTWVKRDLPESKSNDGLDDICASDAKKTSFEFLFKQRTLEYSQKTENLFFAYSAHGEIAFSFHNEQNNSPHPEFAGNCGKLNAAANFRNEAGKQIFAAFGLDQIARPPNFERAASNFETPAATLLSRASQSIKPRSPPFSI